MATQTTNLNLTKPAYSEDADVAVINSNMDILDGKIGAVGSTSLQAQATANSTSIGKIIPKITTTTNNSGYAIAAGDYFEASGILYKATAAIPKNSAWSSSATAQGDSVHGALNGAFDTLNSKIEFETIDNTDANTLKTTKHYFANSGCTNVPANYIFLRVYALSSSVVHQVATQLDGKTYQRVLSGGSWTSWEQLALNSNLTNVQNATASENVTINSGKYLKIGMLVVFSFSFTLSATINENTKILTSLPAPICDNIPFIASPTTSISTLKNTLSCRLASSNFFTNEQFPATSYTVTGSYISAN